MADPAPGRRKDLGALILLALAILLVGALFVWELRSAGLVAIDDAYITFSYSKNLASGHGPIYGHGERVEGYSNFLWMVAVGIGLLLSPQRADPLLVARAVAVPFMLLFGYATYRLVRLRASRLLAVAVLAAIAANADVSTAYLMGLETLPSTALLMLAFFAYARSLDHEPAGERLRAWVVPAFVGVALTRIDGFVPLGFVLLFEAARRAWRREGSAGDYLRWALPGVAVYLGWFAWRWIYYGLPLPTTYYAKALIPKLLPHRGWQYVKDEVMSNGSLVMLPFALLSIARRRRIAGLALASFVALHVTYVVRAGGDWMPYGRFLLPILPLTLVLVAWGGQEIAEIFRPRVGRVATLCLLLPLAALIFIVRQTEAHLTEQPLQKMKRALASEQGTHVKNLRSAARILTWALPAGARLVTDYGGIFAYYTDADPIEMWGLCNAAIATRGGTERVNPIYGRTCPECYPALDPQFFHVWVPLVRGLQSFHSHAEVVASVWQTDTIGRYLDFQRGFVSGRAMIASRDEAVYFLERRRPGTTYRPRTVTAAVTIDYPFEPEGRSPGL